MRVIPKEVQEKVAGKRLELSDIVQLIQSGADLETLMKISPAETIDAAFELREIIREETRKTKEKSEILEVLEDLTLNHMIAAGTEETPLMSMGGMRAVATRSEEDMPSVENWEEFYKYCEENHATYLLQRRLNASGVMSIHSVEPIPGVKVTPVTKLRLRKL